MPRKPSKQIVGKRTGNWSVNRLLKGRNRYREDQLTQAYHSFYSINKPFTDKGHLTNNWKENPSTFLEISIYIQIQLQ